MIEKPRPDLLTLFTTIYDISVFWNLSSRVELRQFMNHSDHSAHSDHTDHSDHNNWSKKFAKKISFRKTDKGVSLSTQELLWSIFGAVVLISYSYLSIHWYWTFHNYFSMEPSALHLLFADSLHHMNWKMNKNHHNPNLGQGLNIKSYAFGTIPYVSLRNGL